MSCLETLCQVLDHFDGRVFRVCLQINIPAGGLGVATMPRCMCYLKTIIIISSSENILFSDPEKTGNKSHSKLTVISSLNKAVNPKTDTNPKGVQIANICLKVALLRQY